MSLFDVHIYSSGFAKIHAHVNGGRCRISSMGIQSYKVALFNTIKKIRILDIKLLINIIRDL